MQHHMAAEEGVDEDNPFSFKAFLSKKETKPGSDGSKKKKSQKTVVGGDTKTSSRRDGGRPASRRTDEEKSPFPDIASAGAKSTDENPFSFKKFVSKKKVTKPTLSTDIFASDSSEGDNSVGVLAPLPTPLVPKEDKYKSDSLTDSSSDDNEQGNETRLSMLPVLNTLGSAMPSGSAEDMFSPIHRSSDSSSSNDEDSAITGFSTLADKDLSAQIKKLKHENNQLKLQISQTQKLLHKESKKSKSLQEEVKRLKAKEVADAKALEEMVQKVEENLEVTTKRAVSAESTITKLKKEIKTLQAKLVHTTPQAMQLQYEEVLAGVRDKASLASQQLHTAAHKADLQIRELMLGVETLKTVSDTLAFIDRITEINKDD